VSGGAVIIGVSVSCFQCSHVWPGFRYYFWAVINESLASPPLICYMAVPSRHDIFSAVNVIYDCAIAAVGDGRRTSVDQSIMVNGVVTRTGSTRAGRRAPYGAG
jgi:hypothetical protein